MKRVWLAALFIALAGCESRFLPQMPSQIGAAKMRTIVSSAGARYSVPIGLIRVVITAESAGNSGAISSAGAEGLMQLMPGTASSCGVSNPFDPFQNVDCGTRYLRQQLARYQGNVRLALAAYNAGPGAVDKYHGVPPCSETRSYVARVLAMYH